MWLIRAFPPCLTHASVPPGPYGCLLPPLGGISGRDDELSPFCLGMDLVMPQRAALSLGSILISLYLAVEFS